MVSRLSSGPRALVLLGALAVALVAACDSPGLSRKAKSPTGPAQATGEASTTGAPLPDKDGAPLDGPTVQTAGLSVSSGIRGVIPSEGVRVGGARDLASCGDVRPNARLTRTMNPRLEESAAQVTMYPAPRRRFDGSQGSWRGPSPLTHARPSSG